MSTRLVKLELLERRMCITFGSSFNISRGIWSYVLYDDCSLMSHSGLVLELCLKRLKESVIEKLSRLTNGWSHLLWTLKITTLAPRDFQKKVKDAQGKKPPTEHKQDISHMRIHLPNVAYWPLCHFLVMTAYFIFESSIWYTLNKLLVDLGFSI